MNDSARLFVNACQFSKASRLLAAAGMTALLGGCVGNPFADAKVDPASPIAAEVAKAAHVNNDYPSFSEIPAKPTDLRPVRMYGRAAKDLQVAAADLVRATDPDTWTLTGTDDFAARARRDVGPAMAPANPADTEAYVKELRRRATPPPPPKR